MSIRLKLTLWYSVVLAATLVAFGVAIYLFVNFNTYKEMKDRVRVQASQIRIGSTLDYDFRVMPTSALDEEMFIQIVNYKKGSIQSTSNLIENDIMIPYPKPTSPDLRKDNYAHVIAGNYPFIVYQHAIRDKTGVIGLLQVAAFSGREDKFLDELRNTLIFSLIVVVLIAFTIGLFLARQALRPIENVIRASDLIQHGSDLSMRIPREGPPNDEMGRLADTLNGMLGRIETTYNELDDAYKAQRRFVSDASHELRTPLTTIRGNIELLEKMWLPLLESPQYQEQLDQNSSLSSHTLSKQAQQAQFTREAMQDIAGEAKRMSGLVNDLLSLARADAGYEMEKTPQQLVTLVEDVARRAQLLPRTAEWIIGDLSALEGVQVNAHADFLRQLFFIFVENAFKYTPNGSVEMRAIRSANQAGIVIKDTGIGMNNDEIPHIFERFYRADESRGQTSGTGLGLSIAKWIIDEHEGSVEVSTREGEGTTFIVWLPITFLDNSYQV
ncbi:two-component sensor histidine kinase [Paenibacillus baekrokdamisoli]|uniref:histidine kinase n=1 Tax=Paenibacillus baekrokdamisoli TaxID=1712516 RepID=A0A3G9JF56_9BACL|nr:HAMP domain-containing sensor histidine kinase [Paenibacillus baekrokdamisoli]MBB3071181.1 signal transduction histidine kinase [Paenibacillus baekrokdamisoli]BBH21599.1 two-component sensor histidine kinase [Paenibacillus baekrokdamisoli]